MRAPDWWMVKNRWLQRIRSTFSNRNSRPDITMHHPTPTRTTIHQAVRAAARLGTATALAAVATFGAQAAMIQGSFTGTIVGRSITSDPAGIASDGTAVSGTFVYDTSTMRTSFRDYGSPDIKEWGFNSSGKNGIGIDHTVGTASYSTGGLVNNATMYHWAMYGDYGFTIGGTEGTGKQNFRFDARFVSDLYGGVYNDPTTLFDVSVSAGTLRRNSSFGLTWQLDGATEQMSGNITSMRLVNLSAEAAPASVPEPASLALVGVALLGAACARKRHQA
jgi:hypothetical protein